jgi:leucyl aminopeptidase
MSVHLKQIVTPADEKALDKSTHILFVLPSTRPVNLPFSTVLDAKLKRSHGKYSDLLKTALTMDLPNGALATWVAIDAKQNTFQRYMSLRKAVKCLLDEKPENLNIAVFGGEEFRQAIARDAYYVTLVNAQELPTRKSKKEKHKPLKTISLLGTQLSDADKIDAQVAGNTLTRTLTMLPPNDLTPGIYRGRIAKLAKINGWQHEEFDMKKLQKLGAGAFVAVGQGSEPQDAAIVHLTYSPKSAKRHMALVGKGICFDTGGHNLKPARYMNGMHEDMNGSAVALGILLAASECKLPIKIDCWLAIAQNHIGPKAYKQNDVITSLNGTTIEIVHTDAEGRMVLADTLTLASRAKPEFMMDFATLTGSMISAVGTRYSGVLGNRPE